MFEVEYLCNGWVKKNRVNVILVYSNTIGLTLDTPIDFAFSPHLTSILLFVDK